MVIKMKVKKKLIFIAFSFIIFFVLFLVSVIFELNKTKENKQNDFVEQKETVIKNAWIFNGKEKEMTVLIDGEKQTFKVENTLSEEISQVVGDLTLKDNRIIRVQVKPDLIQGRVLSVGENEIELLQDGTMKKIPLTEDFKIYHMDGEVVMEQAKGILVGYSNTDFVIVDEKICAALIQGTIETENIRVLIKTDGFQDLFQKEIKIKSQDPFVIKYGNKEKSYPAEKTVTIRLGNKLLKGGRIRFENENKEGKFTVLSIQRNGRNPSYRGAMEISVYEDQLVLINELSLEEYLYGVVPSEMPPSYGVEALKAQAVCARSYAYNQLLSNSYSKYGAHVDDSVSFQVYNNGQEDENTILAVKDTYGQVMKYENQVISAYYFSTSCGSTSSADEVWMTEEKVPYLQGKLQSKETSQIEKAGDLTNEKEFKAFITENEITTYDSQFPWYRWKVSISQEDLKKSIEAGLKKRYKANKELILTLDKDKNVFVSSPIDTIGTIEDIKVEDRKTGGIVTAVIIEGSKETIKVLSEYNIRTLFAPINDSIVRKDDSKVDHLSMLPSAFFIVEKENKTFTFTGGGYGHGVGMSQNGVKAMVDQDMNYKEILEHYYDGIQFGSIYLSEEDTH